jgi:hypothetical protein
MNQKPAPSSDSENATWIGIFIVIALCTWMFGSCQRNITLRNCGRYQGQYIYSWRGTNQNACVIKKGGDNNLEIVTPNGSGKGYFRGNYVIGEAGGRSVTCAGVNVTGLPYGICTD